MQADLSRFLSRYTPLTEERATWGQATRLRITGYLGAEVPPLRYVTSVRCLLLRDGEVLVQRDVSSTHILPGGRREGEETLEQTLHREVLEETGWTLRSPSMLGWMHFHRFGPKPPGSPYPHPDFLQVVYTAQPHRFVPAARLDDGYELESEFRPVAEVRELNITPQERLYLEAASGL